MSSYCSFGVIQVSGNAAVQFDQNWCHYPLVFSQNVQCSHLARRALAWIYRRVQHTCLCLHAVQWILWIKTLWSCCCFKSNWTTWSFGSCQFTAVNPWYHHGGQIQQNNSMYDDIVFIPVPQSWSSSKYFIFRKEIKSPPHTELNWGQLTHNSYLSQKFYSNKEITRTLLSFNNFCVKFLFIRI